MILTLAITGSRHLLLNEMVINHPFGGGGNTKFQELLPLKITTHVLIFRSKSQDRPGRPNILPGGHFAQKIHNIPGVVFYWMDIDAKIFRSNYACFNPSIRIFFKASIIFLGRELLYFGIFLPSKYSIGFTFRGGFFCAEGF